MPEDETSSLWEIITREDPDYVPKSMEDVVARREAREKEYFDLIESKILESTDMDTVFNIVRLLAPTGYKFHLPDPEEANKEIELFPIQILQRIRDIKKKNNNI